MIVSGVLASSQNVIQYARGLIIKLFLLKGLSLLFGPQPGPKLDKILTNPGIQVSTVSALVMESDVALLHRARRRGDTDVPLPIIEIRQRVIAPCQDLMLP